jgi:hypothetical protein
MKAKRQTEAVLNSVTMLDGFGGHVTRMISFNNLQIDHLPKQQAIGFLKGRQSTLRRITMLKREETLATIFTTADAPM